MLSPRQIFTKLRSKITKVDEIIDRLEHLSHQNAQSQEQAQHAINCQHEKQVRTEAIINGIREQTDIQNTELLQRLDNLVQETFTLRLMFEEVSKNIPEYFEHAENALYRNLRPLTRHLHLASNGADPSRFAAIRVHFFFQSPETWTTWQSVWSSCDENPSMDAVLVLLPFDHDSVLENRARAFLADKGISFVDCSAYDLAKERPDLVFLQNPYDSTRPDEFNCDTLRRLNIPFAYIPYGLDVGGGDDNLRWQYDLDVQRYAWRVFVRSAQHKRMYALHCQSGTRHVVVSGHPKMDHIKSTTLHQNHQCATRDDHKTILWTPHFTVEKGGWSTYQTLSEHILSFFERQPTGLALLIRPHPLFFGRLKTAGLLTDQEVSALKDRFNQPPFLLFDDDPEYLDSFAASDALMADAGSFLLEYLPTEKPILYLRNDAGPGLNATGSFVDTYYQAAEFEEIEEFLNMVAAGEDPKRTERLEKIPFVLHGIDGNVGKFICDYIVAHIHD